MTYVNKKRLFANVIFFLLVFSFLPTIAYSGRYDDPFASLTVRVLNRNGMPISGAIVVVRSWAEQKGANPYTSECGSFRLKTNSSGIIYIDDSELTCGSIRGKAQISESFPRIIVSIKASVPGMYERETTDYLTYDNPNCVTTMYLSSYSSPPSSSGSSSVLTKKLPVYFAIKVADDYGNPITGAHIQISLHGSSGDVWMGHDSFGLNLDEMSSEASWTWCEINPSSHLFYDSSPINKNVVSAPWNAYFWVELSLSHDQNIAIKATKSGYRSAISTLRITTDMIMEIDQYADGLYYEVVLKRNGTKSQRKQKREKSSSGGYWELW